MYMCMCICVVLCTVCVILWFSFQIQRYNSLLRTIRSSLVDLEKGIKGLVVMSSDLEEVFNCIKNAQVPPLWEKVYMYMYMYDVNDYMYNCTCMYMTQQCNLLIHVHVHTCTLNRLVVSVIMLYTIVWHP